MPLTRRAVLFLMSGGACSARAELGYLEESDPVAVEVGFTTNVNRHPPSPSRGFVEGQTCSSCDLWRGQEGARFGPCKEFGGQLVPSAGWCSEYQ